jgi:hypothetical protein
MGGSMGKRMNGQFQISGHMRRFLAKAAVVATVGAAISHPATAQPPQSFSLQQGQVLSITPQGKVEYGTMQGNPPHVEEMEKRTQPVTKGWSSGLGPVANCAI